MNKSTKEQDQILIIADTLADDVLNMPDDEIRKEAQESSVGLEATLTGLRAAVSQGQLRANKAKLAAARQAVEAEREQATTASNVADFDLAKARQKIEQLANRSDAARENILLAARNANTPLNELPEDEVRSLLEDMKELGLLDDEE